MPFEIKTPLHGKIILSDRTLGTMAEAIDESDKSGIEHGVNFCEKNGSVDPDSTCQGEKCALLVPRCPPGMKRAGDFHTHPNTMNQKGYAIPSPGDRLHSLMSGDKLNCVWGQQDGKVVCESPSQAVSDEEKKSLIERFDELGSVMRQAAEGSVNPEDRADLMELADDLSARFTTVARADRAGLTAAKAKAEVPSVTPKGRATLEECMSYFSRQDLTDRARKAGLSAEGSKRELSERLIAAGAI